MGQKQSLCHGPREWQYFSAVCHVSSSGPSRPRVSRELHLELINSVVFKSSLDSCSMPESQLTSLCPWNILATGLQRLSAPSLNSPAAITAIVRVRSTLSPVCLPPCLTTGPSRTGSILTRTFTNLPPPLTYLHLWTSKPQNYSHWISHCNPFYLHSDTPLLSYSLPDHRLSPSFLGLIRYSLQCPAPALGPHCHAHAFKQITRSIYISYHNWCFNYHSVLPTVMYILPFLYA